MKRCFIHTDVECSERCAVYISGSTMPCSLVQGLFALGKVVFAPKQQSSVTHPEMAKTPPEVKF